MSIARKLLCEYGKLRKTFNPLRLPSQVHLYRNVHMSDFDAWVNKFEYRSDPLNGLIDYTANPDKFNEQVIYGRDCDDYARQWSLWAIYNEKEAYECIVINAENLFRTAHIVTIVKSEDSYWLMNYHPYGRFDIFEDAIQYMKEFRSYESNMIYVISDHFSKEEIYECNNR